MLGNLLKFAFDNKMSLFFISSKHFLKKITLLLPRIQNQEYRTQRKHFYQQQQPASNSFTENASENTPKTTDHYSK